jgi:hypothetical protein
VPRFNHAFSFSFELMSLDEDGADVTGAQLREAIVARLTRLSDAELVEACEAPYDSYEEFEGPDNDS